MTIAKELTRIFKIRITNKNLDRSWKDLAESGGVTTRQTQEILKVLIKREMERDNGKKD